MVERFNVPRIAGTDLSAVMRWIRTMTGTLNEYFRQTATVGAYFNWDGQSASIPSGEANAFEVVFTSPFVGNGVFIVTVVGAEGGVAVALNGTTLAFLANPDMTSEILYEIHAKNLINGLNSLKFWDTAGDTAELRRVEAWRAFSEDLLDDVLKQLQYSTPFGRIAELENKPEISEHSRLDGRVAQLESTVSALLLELNASVRPDADLRNRISDLELGSISVNPVTGETEYSIQTAVSYQVTGSFDHEIVTVTAAGATTVTMPPLILDQRTTVIREGAGLPTIDGNGVNILGEATQELPTQYDVANMVGGTTEYLLRE